MMGDWVWVHPQLVHLVWIALAVMGLLVWLELRSRGALEKFVSAVMARRLASRQSAEVRVTRLVLIGGMLLFGILALMRPQSTRASEKITASRSSADIVVALDVSRSMLAEDAAPYRLARAKAEVAELIGELRGHRVGLVAFAGRAVVMCPLTPDYNFFNMALRGIDTNSVSRGGTSLSGAIRKALGAFNDPQASKLLLLITDGDDHDQYALAEAQKAKQADVRIITIGFGSEKGSQITLVHPKTGARSKLLYKNVPVVSKLNAKLLRDIAAATKGIYVPAGTAALNLKEIVEEHIEPLTRDAAKSADRIQRKELYHWFVLGSLLCLCGAVWIGAATARRQVL